MRPPGNTRRSPCRQAATPAKAAWIGARNVTAWPPPRDRARHFSPTPRSTAATRQALLQLHQGPTIVRSTNEKITLHRRRCRNGTCGNTRRRAGDVLRTGRLPRPHVHRERADQQPRSLRVQRPRVIDDRRARQLAGMRGLRFSRAVHRAAAGPVSVARRDGDEQPHLVAAPRRRRSELSHMRRPRLRPHRTRTIRTTASVSTPPMSSPSAR